MTQLQHREVSIFRQLGPIRIGTAYTARMHKRNWTRRSPRSTRRMPARKTRKAEGKHDDLEYGKITDQIERMKDEPDVQVTQPGSLCTAELSHRAPIQPVLTCGWRVEQAYHRE